MESNSTAEKYHQAALDHLGRGEPEAALSAIERSLATNFSWAASHATHGLVLATNGKRAAAERAVTAALKLDPQLPYAHFAQGVLIQDEDPNLAVQAFSRALEGDPDNPRFLLQLAVSHLKAGDRDAARSRLMAAVESEPENTTALILLADLYLAQGQWDEAASYTDRILETEPEHSEALLVRCQLALLQGDGRVLECSAKALLAKDPIDKRALEMAALGSLSCERLWRPWWSFMVWRARNDQRKVTLWALLGLGGVLAVSFLLVAVLPNLAVAFHGLLWLIFGYFLGAHFSLRARLRQIAALAPGYRASPPGDSAAAAETQTTPQPPEPAEQPNRPAARTGSLLSHRGRGRTIH